MGDTQQMLPNPVREYLVKFIAEQTGVTNPLDVFFAWLGFGEGIVSWREADPEPDRPNRVRRLKITGADADALREIETGREPDTRVLPWDDNERPFGPRRAR